MSHTTTIKTEVRNAEVLRKACERLRSEGVKNPQDFDTKYYTDYFLADKPVTGMGVNLPGWRKPVVFNTDTGDTFFDNWNGRWGDIKELNRFVDEYTLQMLMETAREQGHDLTFTRREDEIQFEIAVA